MIDIGANLTNSAFAEDFDAVIQDARATGVTTIVITGTSIAASRAALDLADGKALFATAGVHPHDADGVATGWLDDLDALAAADPVVAIGETGLDFYRGYSARNRQESVFVDQLMRAAQHRLPVFVHDRDSEGRTLAILREHADTLVDIVVHCFTGTDEELDGYLDAGFYIGVTGWICDERRGAALREQVRRIPSDRLMIETDAPYLLPRTIRPRPRSRRNVPANLKWVAAEVARCRDESPQVVEQTTAQNAARFFRLNA